MDDLYERDDDTKLGRMSNSYREKGQVLRRPAYNPPPSSETST